VFGGGKDASVDQVVGVELRPSFLCCAFEGEVVEDGRGCVGCYGAGIVFACGAEDGCYDEVVWLGDVATTVIFYPYCIFLLVCCYGASDCGFDCGG